MFLLGCGQAVPPAQLRLRVHVHERCAPCLRVGQALLTQLLSGSEASVCHNGLGRKTMHWRERGVILWRRSKPR